MERPKFVILILALLIAVLTIAQELYVSMKPAGKIAKTQSGQTIITTEQAFFID